MPTTPLSFRPPTSCFSLVVLTSNWLNWSCISFSLATRFSRCSKIAPPRFRFFGLLLGCECLERPALDMAALSCLSCEPPIVTPKVSGCGMEKTTTHHILQSTTSGLAEDAQTFTKFSSNTSIFVLKALCGPSTRASDRNLMLGRNPALSNRSWRRETMHTIYYSSVKEMVSSYRRPCLPSGHEH